MKNVAQLVSFFEMNLKNTTKTLKTIESPQKISVPIQFEQKILTPTADIPKYYCISQAPSKPHPKSQNLVKNPDLVKEPEKIIKNKIKENMANMKALLEKKQIYKNPFGIQPSLNSNSNCTNINYFNNEIKMLEPSNNKLVYDVKPIRNIRKKTKNVFHE